MSDKFLDFTDAEAGPCANAGFSSASERESERVRARQGDRERDIERECIVRRTLTHPPLRGTSVGQAHIGEHFLGYIWGESITDRAHPLRSTTTGSAKEHSRPLVAPKPPHWV